jgi:hypothetical protein
MKLKVISCDDNRKWYADKIGESFPLIRIGDRECYVSTHDSYNTGNFISNCDFEVEYEEKESNSTPS